MIEMMTVDMARARKFIPRPVGHGSLPDASALQAYSVTVALLAAEFAAVRAEHDVSSLMRDERWGHFWALEKRDDVFEVWAHDDDDKLIASGVSPPAAIRAALDTVKEFLSSDGHDALPTSSDEIDECDRHAIQTAKRSGRPTSYEQCRKELGL